MKVFISWSGETSKKLGETIRDWLPGVMQLVKPYFTPADIEKGARWTSDIAKELSEAEIGILCVTQGNLHSDWILFEAGALSKTLEVAHVCPILFNITDTDLAGPLKQFQTTEFSKKDFKKLISLINGRLGDNRLPQKTLDSVFDKWWPDLKSEIDQILSESEEPDAPVRSDRDILEEVLELSRMTARRGSSRRLLPPALIGDLLEKFISLHNSQVQESGGYQDVLNDLKGLEKPISFIVNRYAAPSEELEELIVRFKALSYETIDSGDDDIPF